MTLGFPWLFPGGVGDIYDVHNTTISLDDWADILLRYEDGRFMNDTIGVFYVSNFLTHRKNQSSGAFYVNTFFENGPKHLLI